MSAIATNPKIDRLRAVKFFTNASDRALENLGRSTDEITVPSGRTLISEGEFNLVAYIIEDGEAEVLVGDESVAVLGAGEMIGEVGFFLGGKATATVRAKTDLTVFALPYNRIDSLLDENPAMLRAIAEELAERLQAMDARQQ